MTKRKKNVTIFRVDRDLYPESPLLAFGDNWYNVEGRWLTPQLRPARVDLYEDHLYKDRVEPLLPHVEQEVARTEKKLEIDMKEYHRRLWELAGLLMESYD